MPEACTSKRTGNVCHLKPSRTDRQTSPGRKEPFSCWSRPVYQGAFDEKLQTQSPKGMLWSSNIDQRTLIWRTSEPSSFMFQVSPSDCQGTFQWYMYMKVCGPYPWFHFCSMSGLTFAFAFTFRLVYSSVKSSDQRTWR